MGRGRKMQRGCKCLAPHMLTEQLLPLHPTASHLWSHRGTKHTRNWTFLSRQKIEKLISWKPLLLLPPPHFNRQKKVWEERYMKLLQLVLDCKSYPHSYRVQRKLSLHTAPLLQLHCSGYTELPIASPLTPTINMVFPIGDCFKYHKSYSSYDLIHI